MRLRIWNLQEGVKQQQPQQPKKILTFICLTHSQVQTIKNKIRLQNSEYTLPLCNRVLVQDQEKEKNDLCINSLHDLQGKQQCLLRGARFARTSKVLGSTILGALAFVSMLYLATFDQKCCVEMGS